MLNFIILEQVQYMYYSPTKAIVHAGLNKGRQFLEEGYIRVQESAICTVGKPIMNIRIKTHITTAIV